MALPSSGAITTAQVGAQLGTAGATWPDTDTRALTGVAAGAIVLPTDFHSKGATITAASIAGVATNATLTLNSAGTVVKNEDGVNTQLNSTTDWIIPNAAGAVIGYHVKFTVTAGTTPNVGTFGSYLSLGSNQAIGYTVGAGARNCTVRVDISADGGSTVLVTANFTMSIAA